MPRSVRLPRAPVAAALAASSAVLAALALAGCGEGPLTPRPDGRVAVGLHDYYLAPQRITVPAGRLQVTVRNDGRIAHSFRLRAGENQVLKISALKPGRSVTRRFRLAPGRYVMFCAIGNHEELGMRGMLVVRK